ncbi:hypothetical protein [Streptomyces sp. NPDC098101]|uniref:hypothetical protein n=1 Tax=Streptomyces sp. NPDC098101 TaxID=3366096 RepID=UPI00381ED076
MDVIVLAVEEPPVAAKVLVLFCGIWFLGWGTVFLTRAREVSGFLAKGISSTGHPRSSAPPGETRVRGLGAAGLTVGVLCLAYSLVLFLQGLSARG